jgi:formylmethanofuran dehydrogenase subunit E
MPAFKDVVAFHGHACPGLAFGFRASEAALLNLGDRSMDEELVAVVENMSCAVDAIQVVTGCTLGKGNLVIQDYGKQVYTFQKRPSGEGIRIAVKWQSSPEDSAVQETWKRFSSGDRSPEVMRIIKARKSEKMQEILKADLTDLFTINHITTDLPESAQVYPSLLCSKCGEKVMEPKAKITGKTILCLPCAKKVSA